MIVAIIQARMGSSRLPNKVMKKVLGRPLIDYLLERVSAANKVDKVILATTKKTEDDVLADHVSKLGYHVFRGSEHDVLSRYYHAFYSFSKAHDNYNAIVRITGDCPLIDPGLIDKVVETYQEQGVDYVALSADFAEGLDVEIFSERLLVQAFKEARLDSEREHVALFFHNNRTLFKMLRVQNNTDDSCYRITVDEPQDFVVIESIIKYFSNSNLEMNFKNIKKYLDANPAIFEINSHIIRNEGLKISLAKERDSGNV